jgi:hypothetical protein
MLHLQLVGADTFPLLALPWGDEGPGWASVCDSRGQGLASSTESIMPAGQGMVLPGALVNLQGLLMRPSIKVTVKGN